MNLNKQKLLSRLYRNAADEGGDGGSGTPEPTAAPSAAPTAAPSAAPTEAPSAAPSAAPTDAEAKLLKEVMKKKELLDKATARAADLEEKLKGLDGMTADELKAIVQERKDAETKSLEAKGEYERLKQRMADEHSKQVEALKGTLGSKESEISTLKNQINELTIGSKFSQSQFIGEDLTLTPLKARALYGSHFEFVDGKVVGYDKPRGEAGRTMFVDSLGNPLPFDDAVKKIVDADPERDFLYRSKVKPGAGSNTKPAQKAQPELANDPLSKITAGLATMGKR